MKRSPATLLRLMVLVMLVALGLAAVRVGSYAVLRAMYWTTVTVLIFSLVASKIRPGGEGAYWFGFAAFGWGYFFFALSPWHPMNGGTIYVSPPGRVVPGVNEYCPTNDLVNRYVQYRTNDLRAAVIRTSPVSGSPPPTALRLAELLESLPIILHLELAWLFAIAGGMLAIFIRSRDGRPASDRGTCG